MSRPRPWWKGRRTLGAGPAHLIGWLMVAVVAVIAIAALPRAPGAPRMVRVAHLAYVVGQLLAVGLASYAIVELWRRWLGERRRWAYGAFGVLAVVIAAVVLQDDLVSFLGCQREAGSRVPWRVIVPAVAGGVTWVTVVVGRLLDRAYLRWLGVAAGLLAAADLAERTALIVSADHGEAFEEHGQRYHATSLYEEVLRVPLLIAVPGIPARTIDTPVTLVDVGPTILDLFGLSTPGTFMGESLVPLLRGETPALSRPIVADAGRRMQAMVFADGVKAIRDLHLDTVEVYDLQRDPEERHNRVGDDGFAYRPYLDTLQLFFEVHTLRRDGWKPPWRKF